MTLLHSFKIFSDYLLCSWHWFTYEEFSRKFNRVLASNILHSLPQIAWFFCLAMLTQLNSQTQMSTRLLCSTPVLYRMECRMLERENHAVLLSLSVLNWLSSNHNPEPFFFHETRSRIAVSSSKPKYDYWKIVGIFNIIIVQVHLGHLEKSGVGKTPRSTMGIIQDSLVRLNFGYITGL